MKDDNELCVGVRNSNSDTWCVLYSDGSTDSAVSESESGLKEAKDALDKAVEAYRRKE
jgi:hypothetical protein